MLHAFDQNKIYSEEYLWPDGSMDSRNWPRTRFSVERQAVALCRGNLDLGSLAVKSLFFNLHGLAVELDELRAKILLGGPSSNADSLHTHASSSTGGYAPVEASSAVNPMVKQTKYFVNCMTRVDLTLPTTAALGDAYYLIGANTGGWRVLQNAGQQIHYSGRSTTLGAGGYLDSQDYWAIAEIQCATANTSFIVTYASGRLIGG